MRATPIRTFECPPFPPVVLDDDSGYWQGQVVIGEHARQVSVYVDAAVSDQGLCAAAAQLARLADLRDRGLAFIRQEAADPDVRGFFEFHQAEVPDVVSPGWSTDELVAALGLVGVNLHASERSYRLVLDYSFGRHNSDELLAVTVDALGHIERVSHES